ncbi:hypothetical protein ACFQYP_21225 [Nonomuraea antimicrobica]
MATCEVEDDDAADDEQDTADLEGVRVSPMKAAPMRAMAAVPAPDQTA